MVVLSVLQFHYVIHREMTETVAAATGQDNPGAVSEHDVNALAAHQVRLESFTQIQILNSERYVYALAAHQVACTSPVVNPSL